MVKMASLIKGCCFLSLSSRSLTRHLSLCSPMCTKEWRVSRGLPVMKNSEGVLTDTPDYTFLDGRPTPLLNKQKQRMLKQQGFAKKIIELSAELDFAIERERSITKAKEEERQKIISNRLKPKGYANLKRS